MTDDDANPQDRIDRANRIRDRRESRSGRRTSADTDHDDDTQSPSQSKQSEQSEQSEQQSQPSQSSQRSMSSQNDQNVQGEQSAQKELVKERPHRTIYLPERLDDDLETAIDTLLFEAKTQCDAPLGKNRHAYPLLVYLGLERASEMDVEELLDVLDEVTELDDSPRE